MPVGWLGQQITFATEYDADANFSQYIWVVTRKNDTIRKIAARRGHPEWSSTILKLNKGRDVLPHPKRTPGKKLPPIPRLRAVTQVLRPHVKIRLPGTMKPGFFLNVHAGDKAPHITSGYAKYDVVGVPGRLGIDRFLGYDPIIMDIPIQFENYGDGVGSQIEADIVALERMAGRGHYPGSAMGPPAVVRVSVTDSKGNVVPLIPPNFQWSQKNQTAPLWRVSGIAWDDNPLRNDNGFRVRQAAVVTVTQYTPIMYVQRGVATRAKAKTKR